MHLSVKVNIWHYFFFYVCSVHSPKPQGQKYYSFVCGGVCISLCEKAQNCDIKTSEIVKNEQAAILKFPNG